MLEQTEVKGVFSLNCWSFRDDTYWSTAITLKAELHIFTILSKHALCFPLQFAICVCVEFKVSHGIKQLDEVPENQPHFFLYFECLVQVSHNSRKWGTLNILYL